MYFGETIYISISSTPLTHNDWTIKWIAACYETIILYIQRVGIFHTKEVLRVGGEGISVSENTAGSAHVLTKISEAQYSLQGLRKYGNHLGM